MLEIVQIGKTASQLQEIIVTGIHHKPFTCCIRCMSVAACTLCIHTSHSSDAVIVELSFILYEIICGCCKKKSPFMSKSKPFHIYTSELPRCIGGEVIEFLLDSVTLPHLLNKSGILFNHPKRWTALILHSYFDNHHTNSRSCCCNVMSHALSVLIMVATASLSDLILIYLPVSWVPQSLIASITAHNS